jgi:hypothetical protein
MAQDALQSASLLDLLSTLHLEQLEGAVIKLMWQVVTRIYPTLRRFSDFSGLAKTLLNLLWMAAKQAPIAAWWYDLTLKRKSNASGSWWWQFALAYVMRSGLRWLATSSPSTTVRVVLPTPDSSNLRDWLPSWRHIDVAVDVFDVIATLLTGLQLSKQPSLVHWLGGVILGRPSARDAALKLVQQRLLDDQQQDYRAQLNGLRRLIFDVGTVIVDVRKLVVPVISLLIMLADEPSERSIDNTLTTVVPPPAATDSSTSGTFRSCQQVGEAARHDGCPLCGEDIETPACLPTAGVVCCLSCLKSRLETLPICPFTKVAVSPSSIIRLRE